MKNIVSSVFGYLLSVALAVVFALYLSGRVGWFLVLAFALAPVLSIGMTWIASRQLQIAGQPSANLVSKGDKCRIQIEIKNKWILPTPTVVVEVKDSVSMKCQDRCCLVSVMPFSGEYFSMEYTARICGKAVIGIENVMVNDFFGVFRFSVKNIRKELLQWEVGVIPEIGQVSERDERITRLLTTSMIADNSEETVEAVASTLMGFPGYDNREYVPGDPLKRINWKLSAKKDQLLVRLDDETPGLTINVVLDSVFDFRKINQINLPPELEDLSDEEKSLVIAETAIEDSLGITALLVKRNYTVIYYGYYPVGQGNSQEISQGWSSQRVVNMQDIEELRRSLAYYGFRTGGKGNRIPYEEILASKEGSTIVCTPYADEYLEQEIKTNAAGRAGEIEIYSATAMEGGVFHG